MTTFGTNQTHQTSEQETINHIKKMEKSKSHRPFFLLLPFFLFILFSHLNEYVQHAGIFSVRLIFSFDAGIFFQSDCLFPLIGN
jgi:hypothetical protein